MAGSCQVMELSKQSHITECLLSLVLQSSDVLAHALVNTSCKSLFSQNLILCLLTKMDLRKWVFIFRSGSQPSSFFVVGGFALLAPAPAVSQYLPAWLLLRLPLGFFLHQLCATLPVPLDLPCMECNAAEAASREGGGFIVWREVAVLIESSGAWERGGGGN